MNVRKNILWKLKKILLCENNGENVRTINSNKMGIKLKKLQINTNKR